MCRILTFSYFFLKLCTNLNRDRKENHRAGSVTLCGLFHASLCLVVSWHCIRSWSSCAFKLKILRGSGRGLFRLPRLVHYGALRPCASVALVQLHLAASVQAREKFTIIRCTQWYAIVQAVCVKLKAFAGRECSVRWVGREENGEDSTFVRTRDIK